TAVVAGLALLLVAAAVSPSSSSAAVIDPTPQDLPNPLLQAPLNPEVDCDYERAIAYNPDAVDHEVDPQQDLPDRFDWCEVCYFPTVLMTIYVGGSED